jgi:hypothetical protein
MALLTLFNFKKDGAYNCTSNCGLLHPFSKKKRNRCKEAKRCACACNSLGVLHPELELGCIGDCNTELRSNNPNAFLCDKVGGDVLFARLGIEKCGFQFTESTDFLIGQEQTKQSSEGLIRAIAGGVLLLGFVGLGFLVFKN